MTQEAKIHELQQLEEALEAWVAVLEQEVASLGQEGPGELEPEDSSEDSVTTGVEVSVLQMQPRQIYRPSGPYRWEQRPNCPCAAGNFDTWYWPPSPKTYTMYISLIPEYTLGIDLLKELTITTTQAR